MSTEDSRTSLENIDDLVAAARSFEPTDQDVTALIAGLDLPNPPDGTGGPDPPTGGSPSTGSAGVGAAALGSHGMMGAVAAGVVGAVAVVGIMVMKPSAPQPLDLQSLPMVSSSESPSASLEIRYEAAAPTISFVGESSARPGGSRTKPKTVSPAAREQDIGAEAEILHRARSSMRSDPARALKILGEHRARFPKGALVEERDALRVEALARLGKQQEAEKESDRFRKNHPDSVHADRIDTVMSRESDSATK